MIRHFINQFNKKTFRNIEGVSTNYLEVLKNYKFPGNVRELENIIEHAFVMCRGNTIRRNHLPSYLSRTPQNQENPMGSVERLFNQMEKETILKVLAKHKGNRSTAGASWVTAPHHLMAETPPDGIEFMRGRGKTYGVRTELASVSGEV